MTEEEYKLQVAKNNIEAAQLYKKLSAYYNEDLAFDAPVTTFQDLIDFDENHFSELKGLTEAKVFKKIHEK